MLIMCELSGFVLTQKKMNMYQKFSNKTQHGANWTTGSSCVSVVKERVTMYIIPSCLQ